MVEALAEIAKQSGNKHLNRGNPAWVKGHSGNPKGRQKKADCLIDCIKSELRSKDVNGLTKEQMIAQALVSMAEKGNVKAIELLMSYTIPKPAQENKVDITTKGESVKPEYINLPVDTVKQSIDILSRAGVLTISSN